mgnify:FL=1
MYRIINSKASGKTRQLMEIAKENKAIFVCSNPRAMEAKAHAYGIVGIEFIDYFTFLDDKGKEPANYVVDEIEMLLHYMFGMNRNLTGYTLTNGD